MPRGDGPVIHAGDHEQMLTGNISRDLAHAVEHDHWCEDDTCDITRAREDGYAILAADLLLGATEAELTALVVSFYATVGGEDIRALVTQQREEWLRTDTWTRHAYRCNACGSITFGDDIYTPEQCGSCLASDLTNTRVEELRREIEEAHRLGRVPERQLLELYDLTDDGED